MSKTNPTVVLPAWGRITARGKLHHYWQSDSTTNLNNARSACGMVSHTTRLDLPANELKPGRDYALCKRCATTRSKETGVPHHQHTPNKTILIRHN